MNAVKDIARALPTIALIMGAIVATFYFANEEGVAADPIETAAVE